MSAPPQIFVRNRQLQVWGPLEPATVGLMVEAGVIQGALQVSLDGVTFADPSRFPPKVREFFPPELGGNAPAAQAPQLGSPSAAPAHAPSAPAAGPGTGAATMAGPGARAAAADPRRPIAPPVRAGTPGPPRPPMSSPAAGAPPVIAPSRAPGAGAQTPTIAPVLTPAGAQAPTVGPVTPAGMQRPSAIPVITPAGPTPTTAAPVTAQRPNVAPVAQAAAAPPVVTPVSPTAEAQSGGAAPVDGAPSDVQSAPSPWSTGGSPAGAPVTAVPPKPTTTVPPSGELSKLSGMHLYYLAAAGDHTGLLRLNLADRTMDVHFRKGNPEYVASTHPEDSLGGFLLSNRLVGADQLAQAESSRDRFGGELIGALFGLGILNPATAFTQLAQRATLLLIRALFAESGTFTWEVKELPAHRALPLGNRWGPVLELMRRLPLPELRRRMQPLMDRPLMKSGGRVALSDLRLTAQETRALGHVDGVRSLNQLAQDVPQDAENLLRLAFALKELEAVSFAEAPTAPRPSPVTPPPSAPPGTAAGAPRAPTAAPTPAAARPSAAPPGAPRPAAPTAAPARPAPTATAAKPAPAPAATPAAPVNFDTDLKELRAKAASLKEKNHFEVLGVPQSADAGQVKIAYFKMAKLYHPDTISPDAPAELAKLTQDIFARVGEAYRTLSDDAARANYVEELKSGAGEIDVAQILAAEETFQKGTILVKARKFPDAVKMLDEAITANPEEGEFYAWRGFAKFFVTPDKKVGRSEAEKDLQLALKKNARCAQAYYFLGQVAKLSGDNAAALTQFKKTIEMQPDHVDAQREIRMSAGKK